MKSSYSVRRRRRIRAIAFYIFGALWIFCAVISIGYAGAVEQGGPVVSGFLKSILWGAMSFASLALAGIWGE